MDTKNISNTEIYVIFRSFADNLPDIMVEAWFSKKRAYERVLEMTRDDVDAYADKGGIVWIYEVAPVLLKAVISL